MRHEVSSFHTVTLLGLYYLKENPLCDRTSLNHRSDVRGADRQRLVSVTSPYYVAVVTFGSVGRGRRALGMASGRVDRSSSRSMLFNPSQSEYSLTLTVPVQSPPLPNHLELIWMVGRWCRLFLVPPSSVSFESLVLCHSLCLEGCLGLWVCETLIKECY